MSRSYTRARYGYDDDPNQRHPLLGGAGPTIATTSPVGRNSEYSDVYKKGDDQPSFWLRTFAIGVIFFVMGAAICGAALYWYIWVGLALAVVLPWVLQYLAVPLFSCCYPAPPPVEQQYRRGSATAAIDQPWMHTVKSIAFWALLLGGLVGAVGGYFGRELYVVQQGMVGTNVDSVAAPIKGLGLINSFAGGAKPDVTMGGRSLAMGFWPVCVAPVVASHSQKVVSYWALGSGKCCGQPMSCDDWGSPTGATVYNSRFLEFFPGAYDAVKDATARYSLLPDDQRVYVHWGSPSAIQHELSARLSMTLAIGSGLAFIVLLYRSIKGPYATPKKTIV